MQDAPGAQAQAGDGGRSDDAVDQLLDDPFERGDAFVPASGPPRREAGARLPGAVPVPGVLLPVPPALGVPALFGLRPGGERGDLEAVVKDAESKLPIALEGLPALVRGGRGGGGAVLCAPGCLWELLNEARLTSWADVILGEDQSA